MKIGDTVRLKSGGPLMTVRQTGIGEEYCTAFGRNGAYGVRAWPVSARCCWYDAGKLNEETIPCDCLAQENSCPEKAPVTEQQAAQYVADVAQENKSATTPFTLNDLEAKIVRWFREQAAEPIHISHVHQQFCYRDCGELVKRTLADLCGKRLLEGGPGNTFVITRVGRAVALPFAEGYHPEIDASAVLGRTPRHDYYEGGLPVCGVCGGYTDGHAALCPRNPITHGHLKPPPEVDGGITKDNALSAVLAVVLQQDAETVARETAACEGVLLARSDGQWFTPEDHADKKRCEGMVRAGFLVHGSGANAERYFVSDRGREWLATERAAHEADGEPVRDGACCRAMVDEHEFQTGIPNDHSRRVLLALSEGLWLQPAGDDVPKCGNLRAMGYLEGRPREGSQHAWEYRLTPKGFAWVESERAKGGDRD